MQRSWGPSMLGVLEQQQGGKEGWRRPGGPWRGPELHCGSRATEGPKWVFTGSLWKLSGECTAAGENRSKEPRQAAVVTREEVKSGWTPGTMAEQRGLQVPWAVV